MGYVIRMPQMGMTMDEGTVLEWYVEEGATVAAGDSIAEVESEKTVIDVESREDGTVERILVDAGTTVGPGDPIGILTGPDETAEEIADEIEEHPPATTSAPDTSSPGTTSSDESQSSERPRATPGARRRADEAGIALAEIEGSGPQGVITEGDVEAAAEERGTREGAAATTEPLSTTQRTIADRLQRSTGEGAHVTLRRSIDAGPLLTATERADDRGLPVGISDLVIKAVGSALAEHPRLNAHFEDGELRRFDEVNVAVAVDMERGLLTPVIPAVTRKSVEAIGRERRSLTDRVRADEVTAEELQGGTFTVSNLGMFDVDSFDPIVDPPQIGILGVGRVRDGTMTLSLTFDHRVVNGAPAARFIDDIAEELTDPTSLRDWFDAEIDLGGGRSEETRSITVRSSGGLSGEYTVGGIDVPFDEPTDVGGSGQAPTPVEHLLGALGSCLTLSVRAMAERDQVEVGEINCQVEGRPTSGPLEGVTIEMTLETDGSDDDLDRILTKAERACYVERSLGEGIAVDLGWTRR